MTPQKPLAPASPAVGRTIAHYVLQEELGGGSTGVVFRAHDARLKRPVAIKVLDRRFRAEGTAWVRLLHEARAAAALNHPGICTVFDIGEENGQAYLVMELVEGRSLHAVIPGHGLNFEAVARYGAQVALALAHAHERGIWHGDVRSQNVTVAPDDRVKILDFGLAGFRLHGATPPTPDEGMLRDLRQFGVLLCEMAAGEFPSKSPEVVAGTLPAETVLESSSVVALPIELRHIIERCLTNDPERRYQRTQQAASDLEVLSQGLPVPILRRRRVRRILLSAAVAVPALAAALLAPPVRRFILPRAASPAASPAPARTAKLPNADAKVWVNRKSRLYHCSDSVWYGKTRNGEYMRQDKAQEKGYRPAYGQPCQ